MSAAGAPIAGGCLCGGVRYEVRGPFLRAGHCHCSRCRKHSGAAVSTQGRVRRDDFRLLRGEELIEVFGRGEGAVKAFCRRCGSSLFGGTWPEGSEVSIRLGSVDGDPGIRPQYHTFVDSRAPWDRVADDLPQFPGALPAGGPAPWSAPPAGEVSGLGGVFFKARDPEGLKRWYCEHLGLPVDDHGYVSFHWRHRDDPGRVGYTVWATFAEDTSYFDPSRSRFMINYRVRDLRGMLEKLRAAGVEVADRTEESEFGKFGWASDPEGNRIELWEPPEDS